ncbi:MAG: hypothetical protein QM790_16085 [Nibricoccus sp.]
MTGTNEEPPPPPELPQEGQGGLFETPAAALRDVRDLYNKWTANLTQRSFELSVGVIAANWAVLGKEAFNSSFWAKLSIVIVFSGLALTLFGTWHMARLLDYRVKNAEKNPANWKKGFDDSKGKVDPWPYTQKIEDLGSTLRLLKTFAPLLGGLFFVIAVIQS